MCRGIIQEKKKIHHHIRAVAQIPKFFNPKMIDSEDLHDREEALCTRTSPVCNVIPLRRLVERRDRQDRISEILAWDDLTGMKLDAGKVKEARSKEVHNIRDKRVYDKIPRSQAIRQGWKIIQTRWIDINKGDHENPVYRSRMVGTEFNN